MKPEDRTKYLCNALGWQGGTVHQLADVTGCAVNDLLYGEFTAEYDHEYCTGHYWDTNSKEYQEENLIPRNKGNLFYWLGVARKMQILKMNCSQEYNRI